MKDLEPGWDGRGLISTAWLAAQLGDERLRVFDTTVHLHPANPGPFSVESGRSDYEAGHVPGAGFLDLPGDLSVRDAPLNFTRPEVDRCIDAFAAAGIGPKDRLVLYSTTTPMWATRIWWMLHAAGFVTAVVLDGGFAKWAAEGRPVEEGACRYAPTALSLRPRTDAWAGGKEVLAAVDNGSACIVNALPADIHSGKAATHWGRRGHIKGSRSIPFDRLLDQDGVFYDDALLRVLFEDAGAFRHDRVICYCGGGISATMNAFALVRLGHPSVAVYDGSMSEWARDPALPMEIG